MTVLNIPELHPELRSALQQIITKKYFDPQPPSFWPQTIRPRIRERMVEVYEYSITFPENPDWNLPGAITRSRDRILEGIDTKFTEFPPFTIYRVSELLLHPECQGFNLSNSLQIFKYFNALQKLFTVSSTANEFPTPTISCSKPDPSEQTSEKLPENVSLVKIPWLESSPNKPQSLDSPKSEEEETGDADTTIDSSPISNYPDDYDGISHKRQRMSGSLDVNRQMTGSSLPHSEEYSSLQHSQETSVCPS